MRHQITKLTKGHSTKGERKFAELLKELRISFKTKQKICGREVDFLIGNVAIEIDGHEQDSEKNLMLISKGFHPVHLNNWEVTPHLKEWLKKISWQEHH